MLETPTAFAPAAATPVRPAVTDRFCRRISYLRVSVTDRCDFRCSCCMSERPQFLPRKDLLTLEELDRLCSAFVGMGVTKLRVTGGEPLVRKDVMTFFRAMPHHLGTGALPELTLTTGSQLGRRTVSRHRRDRQLADVPASQRRLRRSRRAAPFRSDRPVGGPACDV